MPYDIQAADGIRVLLADQPGVVERKMMGGLTFMTESGMFCSASGKGGLLVRVDPEARDSLLGEDHVAPADISGRRMTGFIRVAAEGYRTEASLKKWVERGLGAASHPSAKKKSRSKAPGPKRAKRGK